MVNVFYYSKVMENMVDYYVNTNTHNRNRPRLKHHNILLEWNCVPCDFYYEIIIWHRLMLIKHTHLPSWIISYACWIHTRVLTLVFMFSCNVIITCRVKHHSGVFFFCIVIEKKLLLYVYLCVCVVWPTKYYDGDMRYHLIGLVPYIFFNLFWCFFISISW